MGHCGAAGEPGCGLVWPPRSRSHLLPGSFYVEETFISEEATGEQHDEQRLSVVQFLLLKNVAFFHMPGCFHEAALCCFSLQVDVSPFEKQLSQGSLN